MKSTELNKIMRKLILPDRFKKKGRLAYYTLAHKTGAMVLVGFYLDNSIDPNSFFVNYFAQVHFLDKIISLNKRDDSNLFLHQIENAQLLKGYIETGEYDKGVSQILQWQEQTIKGIGLKINDQRL